VGERRGGRVDTQRPASRGGVTEWLVSILCVSYHIK